MENLEKKFAEVKEGVGNDTPNIARLEREKLEEEYANMHKELERLQRFFRGAQEYAKELEEENRGLRAELKEKKELAETDPLTGLLNRRAFEHDAEVVFRNVSQRATQQEKREGGQIDFSVIFLDIDNFKRINDDHGHAAGDAALKAVSRILQQRLRQGDLVGRWGGEEFVVAMMGHNPGARFIVAEKLRRALEQADFSYEGTPISLTASFGVAKYHAGEELSDIIARADAAMYEAKKAGKNRVMVSQE